LSPVYELDVAFAAIARLRLLRPDLAVTLDLYGRDFHELPLGALATDLGIGDAIRFHDRIPVDAVPGALAEADIGLAPTRQSAFTDFSLSTKLFEYAAMAKPVVASRLPLVERVLGDAVTTYAPGDAHDLAAAVLGIVDEPLERETRIARARARVADLGWEREAGRYLSLVERLAIDGRPAQRGRADANSEAGGR
jgi:glycosyltransferase involved in cell wall biosynthesis